MKQTLLSYTQQPLFDAASAFLGKLGIRHSGYATKEPVPLIDYFDEVPQYLQDANSTIDKLYDLGWVNDTSLGGTSSIENPKYVAMNLFAFDAKPQARITRTVVSSLTRAFNRIADDPVILIIRQGNFVTLSTCDREKGAKVEIMGKVTILRNIDCTNPHPGHIQILDRIAKEVNGCSDFDTLYKKWLYSFSLKLLSDDFFNGYKAIYEDIIALTTGKRMKKEGNKWVERVDDEIPAEEKATYGAKVMASFAQFEDPEKAVRDYVKKLMGRLVFIQFLQKKGWMGVPADKPWGEGDRDFIQNLFKQSSKKDNFVDEVLEPLFRDINNDRAGFLVSSTEVNFGQQIKVPYLNGGLFEEDSYDRADFAIPAKYFWNEDATLGTKDKDLGLLQFFAKYNFTIDENAPDDEEVGVDPEMLGRIFENLLEDNKDKGAFYTPKEIVHYMCRESLIAYLITYSVEHGNTNPYDKIEAAIRMLVTSPTEIVPQMRQHKPQALLEFGDALRNVKICDPAIGSGAFPMGLLNELVRCREAIGAWAKDEEGNLLVDNRAALKCEIVCNNIYGVDIERGAIDIARLRFWLSIVVDEKTPQTLPNLDYKFMQGNSLITTFDGEYVNLDTKTQQHINVGKMNEEKKKLYNYKVRYYSATGDQKHKLAVQIKNSILTLISLQLDFEYRSLVEKNAVQTNFLDEKTSFSEVKAQLSPEKQRICDLGAELRKQLKDETKSLTERAQVDIRFFDWRMMFTEVFEGENPGFDIVIGNPPYNEIRDLDDKSQNSYKQSQYHKYAEGGRINMFQYFYPLGIDLVRKKGIISLITQNSLLAEDSALENRKFIFDKSTILKIDSYPERDDRNKRVFESAKMSVCIMLLSKGYSTSEKKFNVNVWESRYMDKKKTLEICYSDIKKTYPNDLIIPICDKIQLDILLKMLNATSGISISANAGEIDMRKYKNDFIYSSSGDVMRVVTGAQALRYYLTDTPSQGGVKYLPSGVVKLTASRIAVLNDRRIVMQRITGVDSRIRLIATIIPAGLLCANSTNYISEKNNDLPLETIIGILNSKAINYFFKATSTNTNVTGKEIARFPIPYIFDETKNKFREKVTDIIMKKKSKVDTYCQEHEIDRLVYELYGLTNGEVKIIDPNETTVGSDDDLFKA